MNDFLNSIEVHSENEDEDDDNDSELNLTEINGYTPKPISITANITEYWKEKEYSYPRLYELAKVVHSVPATQVSVERAFSALKFLLADIRCNLSSDSVKKLLFLNLNKESS